MTRRQIYIHPFNQDTYMSYLKCSHRFLSSTLTFVYKHLKTLPLGLGYKEHFKPLPWDYSLSWDNVNEILYTSKKFLPWHQHMYQEKMHQLKTAEKWPLLFTLTHWQVTSCTYKSNKCTCIVLYLHLIVKVLSQKQ